MYSQPVNNIKQTPEDWYEIITDTEH